MTNSRQHDLYLEAGERFAPAIARLCSAVERDPDRARDLAQDIHCELFRSFARFNGDCSLKTWVYRVAHNIAAEHRLRESRRPQQQSLDEIEHLPDVENAEALSAERLAVEQARRLIRQLPTLDAQIMVLWLEGESAKDMAEITGLGEAAIATRIHRLKSLIAAKFTPPTPMEKPE